MARRATSSRSRLVYVVAALLALMVLVVGDFVFHWPSLVLALGIAVLSIGNIALSLSIKKDSDGSRHG